MRILIVDDHLAVGEALAYSLAESHEVVGVLDDPAETLPSLAGQQVDLVLLDGTLSRCDVYDLIRRIALMKTKVVVMTMYAPTSRWPALRRMGAFGVIAKSAGLERFKAELSRLGALQVRPDDGDRAARTLEPTSRQLEILIEMARGGPAKEIAANTRLSLSRTNELIGEVVHLLEARDWADAVLRAVELGWIEPWVPPPASQTGPSRTLGDARP